MILELGTMSAKWRVGINHTFVKHPLSMVAGGSFDEMYIWRLLFAIGGYGIYWRWKKDL